MFSKEESALLRKEFWISFGKSFPRKWILYNTKIKGFSFKFVADRKKALVTLDIEHPDEIANEAELVPPKLNSKIGSSASSFAITGK